MGDAVIVVDPSAGISARQLVEWWGADVEAREVGVASVRAATSNAYGPEVVDWVVIPLAVNLASSALYDLVKRLVARSRPVPTAGPELEITATVTGRGDPVVVLRATRAPMS